MRRHHRDWTIIEAEEAAYYFLKDNGPQSVVLLSLEFFLLNWKTNDGFFCLKIVLLPRIIIFFMSGDGKFQLSFALSKLEKT